MVDLAKLTAEEMIEDYYASLMDAKTCERLCLDDRAETNRKIMAVIDAEFERRDIVPPWRTNEHD